MKDEITKQLHLLLHDQNIVKLQIFNSQTIYCGILSVFINVIIVFVVFYTYQYKLKGNISKQQKIQNRVTITLCIR